MKWQDAVGFFSSLFHEQQSLRITLWWRIHPKDHFWNTQNWSSWLHCILTTGHRWRPASRWITCSTLYSFCSNYLLVFIMVFHEELCWYLDNINKRNTILQGSGKRINREVTKSAGLKWCNLVKVNISWSDFTERYHTTRSWPMQTGKIGENADYTRNLSSLNSVDKKILRRSCWLWKGQWLSTHLWRPTHCTRGHRCCQKPKQSAKLPTHVPMKARRSPGRAAAMHCLDQRGISDQNAEVFGARLNHILYPWELIAMAESYGCSPLCPSTSQHW